MRRSSHVNKGSRMQATQNNMGIFRVFKPTILFQAPALPSLQQLLLPPEPVSTAALWNQSFEPVNMNYASTALPPRVPPQISYHELGIPTPIFHQHIVTEPHETLALQQSNVAIESLPESVLNSDKGNHNSAASPSLGRVTGDIYSKSKARKKRFPCPFCDIRCSNNGQLQGHLRIHSGERPFRCNAENCDRSFARNEELTRHKRIHTGFRPHKCGVCEKAFGRKDHLSKHEKTHLQESENLASGCGQRYSRSDALTRHQWTAHSIDRRHTGRGVKLP